MKVVFVGGGSHKYLSVARSVLADKALFDNGEINVLDLNVQRAEAMGRMIMKSPEFQDINCKVSWGTTLEEALEGADVVMVILMAGDRKNYDVSRLVCNRHGFLGSDQLSPSGAFLALKGGPILMNIARKMETLCPDATLVDFANPVAVLSAAVNNHTKIRCLGVCGGYTNHMWDLTRILYGKDECLGDYVINCAGVNHMSFILEGSTHRGEDIYELAGRLITDDTSAPELSDRWNETTKKNIIGSVTTLAGLYRKYGYMVFSSEGDGLAHLDIEGVYLKSAAQWSAKTEEQIDEELRGFMARRAEQDLQFISYIDADMDDAVWNTERSDALYLLRDDENIMVKIMKALGGASELRIATSYPNNGAVKGFKDRTVLEYSQILGSEGIRAAGEFEIPDVFQGLVSALATHQTLLGDAIATKDPRILFDALYSYPVKQDTAESKALWKALLELSKDEIPKEFQETKSCFDV